MSAEAPPNKPIVKTKSLTVQVPIDYEPVGAMILLYDKHQKCHLEAPLDNPPLALSLMAVIVNTISMSVASQLHRDMNGVRESGLWVPPGAAQRN